MKFSMRFFLLLLSFNFSLSLFAQDDIKYQDIFYLKNKIKIYGELLEIKNDTFFLELRNGNKSYLKMKDVKDVFQNSQKEAININNISFSRPNILNLEKKGFFQFSGHLGFGNSSNLSQIIFNSWALEVKYLRRYHLHHFFTASYGVELQELHDDALLHPVTIGHQSILLPKLNTPFINFNLGYTFAHSICSDCLLQTKGGIRYGVGAGMLFGFGSRIIFKTGLEFTVQHSQAHFEDFFPAEWIYRNSRLNLTAGLMF